MTTQQATTAANIALVRSSLDAFNQGDIDACAALLSPDFVMNMAGLPHGQGPDVWRQGAEVIKRGFPDLHAHIDDVVAEGDQVALRLTFRGTHQGEFLGMPATGRTIEYISHEFYRIADGLFAEEWICSDMATLHAQLTAASTGVLGGTRDRDHGHRGAGAGEVDPGEGGARQTPKDLGAGRVR